MRGLNADLLHLAEEAWSRQGSARLPKGRGALSTVYGQELGGGRCGPREAIGDRTHSGWCETSSCRGGHPTSQGPDTLPVEDQPRPAGIHGSRYTDHHTVTPSTTNKAGQSKTPPKELPPDVTRELLAKYEDQKIDGERREFPQRMLLGCEKIIARMWWEMGEPHAHTPAAARTHGQQSHRRSWQPQPVGTNQ